MAKAVDELGYKYYWTTEDLLDNQLRESYNSTNTPRLLVRSLYILSQVVVNSVSEQKRDKNNIMNAMSFDDMRKQTLMNLEATSKSLIKVEEISQLPDWKDFGNILSVAGDFCEQVISYRNIRGNLFRLGSAKGNNTDLAGEFEETLGADGLTNEQWIKLSQMGGSAPDLMRQQARTNTAIIVEMRKAQRGIVDVGDLEQIGLYSNTIEGYRYTYFGNPPKQLSFIFSTDYEFVIGLINWIIYINSGNPVSLDKILGLEKDFGNNLGIELNELLGKDKNYRDIIDSQGDSIKLEINKKYFKTAKFSSIQIVKVLINKTNSNQIEFIGNSLDVNGNIEVSELKIITLKRISGNLLNKVRNNILYVINNDESYKEEPLNLDKQ